MAKDNYEIVFAGFDKVLKKYREKKYKHGIEGRCKLIKSLQESYQGNDPKIISEFKRIEAELNQIKNEKSI